MNRLIDADTLLAVMKQDTCDECEEQTFCRGLYCFEAQRQKLVKDAPTVRAIDPDEFMTELCQHCDSHIEMCEECLMKSIIEKLLFRSEVKEIKEV